ncbi:ABC transporter ATP-binding protein [Planctomycetes bacterium K23_9]|uniref:Putative ABC transporter ATP-binding protein YbhF n=1 Tax=Stieleria marina TaxID=1930275 RepID=A0A517NXZ3_9BACT|nr:putative ABC transporter ATP-binding protein YbhF [Planctomycetes bacterium K23_9]
MPAEANHLPIIEAEKLQMKFRRIDALRGVNLQVNRGSVFALLGENGAGKSTLIRILTGFQKPSDGSARVCGLDPARQPDQVRRQIGYVSDAPSLYPWMTVAETGGFAASLYDAAFLERYQRSINAYEIRADQKIKHLSKGQRAKVALSLALAHDPSLLILDEPTSGLDPKVRKSFLESMIDRAATGQTVFLSSHQISEVERVADQVAILHRGKIVLVGALDEIRDSVSRLVIDVDDPLRAIARLPAPATVLSEDTAGRQRQLFVRQLQPAMINALREQEGVTEVRHHSATLEEIFVAYTLPSSESNSGDSNGGSDRRSDSDDDQGPPSDSGNVAGPGNAADPRNTSDTGNSTVRERNDGSVLTRGKERTGEVGAL